MQYRQIAPLSLKELYVEANKIQIFKIFQNRFKHMRPQNIHMSIKLFYCPQCFLSPVTFGQSQYEESHAFEELISLRSAGRMDDWRRCIMLYVTQNVTLRHSSAWRGAQQCNGVVYECITGYICWSYQSIQLRNHRWGPCNVEYISKVLNNEYGCRYL